MKEPAPLQLPVEGLDGGSACDIVLEGLARNTIVPRHTGHAVASWLEAVGIGADHGRQVILAPPARGEVASLKDYCITTVRVVLACEGCHSHQ